MAGPQRALSLNIMFPQKVGQCLVVVGYTLGLTNAAEYLAKCLVRGIANVDSVPDAAQKGLIHQIFGFQVGGKDNKHLKRNFYLAPGVQSKIVNPFLQGYNPTIQQVLRSGTLAAKVIYQEHASIGFDLKGCFVELGSLVKHQIQRL